jgi:Chemotaxis protein; stimulates methylation of MCP proteins
LKSNSQFGKLEQYIGPGGYYSSRDDVIISTLLGSCISVALYDPGVPVGGMNHFMLPFPKVRDDSLYSSTAMYGINAMEVLINDILKKGGRKNCLRAKVFGGSTVLAFDRQATYDIPKMNITFIFDFLEREHLPVDSYSVGGSSARKIWFFPQTARVLMSYSKASSGGLARRENIYSQKLLESTSNAGKPILF